MKNFKLVLILMIAITTLSFNNIHAQHKDNLIVLVKYKTQPAKESVALSSLMDLIANVKKEPDYVNIKILVDPSDKRNILLYEEWSNEDYYKGKHMQTPHLQKFMVDAKAFLAGPPEITYWKSSDQ